MQSSSNPIKWSASRKALFLMNAFHRLLLVWRTFEFCMNCFSSSYRRLTSEANWPQRQVVLNIEGEKMEMNKMFSLLFLLLGSFSQRVKIPDLPTCEGLFVLTFALIWNMKYASFWKLICYLSGRPPIQPGDKICGGAVIGELGDQIMVCTFFSFFPLFALGFTFLVSCLFFIFTLIFIAFHVLFCFVDFFLFFLDCCLSQFIEFFITT